FAPAFWPALNAESHKGADVNPPSPPRMASLRPRLAILQFERQPQPATLQHIDTPSPYCSHLITSGPPPPPVNATLSPYFFGASFAISHLRASTRSRER